MRLTNKRGRHSHKCAGFTLIEVIVGMVTLSIALSVVINLIVPTEQQSADQIHQIKAAELGQSLLDEILGRSFDENSDHVGSIWRCDEIAQNLCTLTPSLGPDPAEIVSSVGVRSLFNDVDDYNGYEVLGTSTDGSLDDGYDSFTIAVTVVYDDANVLGLGLSPKGTPLAKLITVTITTPLKTEIKFASYKANF